ncbi:hypothetical protein MKW94_008510 [Papaver nudicaule]|uniref:Uncharacterized protein n=1 Tax=Papaver nudicaule TaxID=74823 RepID=A0AA42AWE3_PAPNU|nr:hypothetical protein [Papaver nudicaule]
MPSRISCIQRTQKQSICTPDDGPSNPVHHALVATLGSDASGGSLYMLNLSESLDLNPTDPVLRRRMTKVASVNGTIWTADCNSNGFEAVIGNKLNVVGDRQSLLDDKVYGVGRFNSSLGCCSVFLLGVYMYDSIGRSVEFCFDVLNLYFG